MRGWRTRLPWAAARRPIDAPVRPPRSHCGRLAAGPLFVFSDQIEPEHVRAERRLARWLEGNHSPLFLMHYNRGMSSLIANRMRRVARLVALAWVCCSAGCSGPDRAVWLSMNPNDW